MSDRHVTRVAGSAYTNRGGFDSIFTMQPSHVVVFTLLAKKGEPTARSRPDPTFNRYGAPGYPTLYIGGEKAPQHLLVVYPSEPTNA